MRSVRYAATAFVLLLLSVGACGSTERDPARVTISGVVFTDFRIGPCGEEDAMRPDELSGIELTFTDGSGAPLGGTLTGPLRTEPIADGCRFLADYQVVVPPATSYRVEFDPSEPRTRPGGGYFDGAEQLVAQEMPYDQLAAAGFEWNFEAQPGFVVP
jgi:hypothetical protein